MERHQRSGKETRHHEEPARSLVPRHQQRVMVRRPDDLLHLVIRKALRKLAPEIPLNRRNQISVYVRQVYLRALRYRYRIESRATGRPPIPQSLLRERVDSLVRKPDGELFRRYKRGRWAQDTIDYVEAWWWRRANDELGLHRLTPALRQKPFPRADVEKFLGRPQNNPTMKLVELLFQRRYGISLRTIERATKT